MQTPGFGHPGFSGFFFDGSLYATAKGGVVRVEVETGTEVPIAPAPFSVSDFVEVDGELWAIRVQFANEVLALSRYDVELDRWDSRREQKSGSALGEDVENRSALVGSIDGELVVCSNDGTCAIFDPLADPMQGAWRSVSAPGAADVPGKSVVTEHGLARIVLAQKDGRGAAMYILDEGTWTQRGELLPVVGLGDETSVVAAGDWMIVFSGDQDPIIANLETGDWAATPWPPTGARLPNTVWTGDQLIVWAGEIGSDNQAQGAVWTPPLD